MKNQILTLLITFTLLFICCSSNDDKPNDVTSNITFSAKIDGVEFKPDCISALNSSFANTILVTGSNCTTGETIQFFFPEATITEGTFTTIGDPLSSPFIQAYYAPAGSDGDANDQGNFASGSITITNFDMDAKQITGNFSFTTTAAVNSGISWNVTEGSFNVTYSDI